MLHYLNSREAMNHAWSVYFDPREIGVLSGSGSGITKFFLALQPAAEFSSFPASDGKTLTWMEIRKTAIEHTVRIQKLEVLRGPNPMLDNWDYARERRWISALHRSPIEPLVSVVMPVWNREAVISRAIESVRAQTYSNWELLVVDDGSTDRTREIIITASEMDSRIRLIELEHDGVCVARNHGIDQAHGEFLAFLDSDNEWKQHFLETMVAAMLTGSHDFGYSVMEIVNDKGISSYRAIKTDLNKLVNRNVISMIVMMVSTALAREVGGFNPRFRRMNDHDFIIRLAERVQPQLFPFVGVVFDDKQDGTEDNRITTTEPQNWKPAVQASYFSSLARNDARVQGRLSVVVLLRNSTLCPVDRLRALETWLEDIDYEIVVVDGRLNIEHSVAVAIYVEKSSRSRYVRISDQPFDAVGFNAGFGASTGEFVFLLNGLSIPLKGSATNLVRNMRNRDVLGVQPVLVGADDLISGAGYAFGTADGFPVRWLEGHSPDDAVGLGETCFAALSLRALLVRGDDLEAVQGVDGYYTSGLADVDLCRRMIELRSGSFRVEEHVTFRVPDKGSERGVALDAIDWGYYHARWGNSLVPDVDRLAEASGFTTLGIRASESHSDRWQASTAGMSRNGVDNPTPTRWALRNPATLGSVGDSWGDTFFLSHLGEELAARGLAVKHYRQTMGQGVSALHDDVQFVLRGLRQLSPIPGLLNVLWVISNPETVTTSELRGFDLVYAASPSWARSMSEISKVDVRTMLQATDTGRFSPFGPIWDYSDDIVFVGNARPSLGPRAVVMDAISAGVNVKVWGKYWDKWISPQRLVGTYIDNDHLAALYRGAKLVLLDHHPEMARRGFIANRVFDSVASGARVISDRVEGIEEMFGGAVQCYDSLEELAYLASAEGIEDRFPDDSEMLNIAHEVAQKHSFKSRVDRLAADVQTLLHAKSIVDPPSLE